MEIVALSPIEYPHLYPTSPIEYRCIFYPLNLELGFHSHTKPALSPFWDFRCSACAGAWRQHRLQGCHESDELGGFWCWGYSSGWVRADTSMQETAPCGWCGSGFADHATTCRGASIRNSMLVQILWEFSVLTAWAIDWPGIPKFPKYSTS